MRRLRGAAALLLLLLGAGCHGGHAPKRASDREKDRVDDPWMDIHRLGMAEEDDR